MNMQKLFEKDEIDLGAYLKILLKRRKTIVFVILVYLLLVLIVLSLLPKKYEAKALVRVGSISKPIYSMEGVYEEFRSLKMLTTVIKTLKLDIAPSELREKITVVDLGEGVIAIKVRHTNPKECMEICTTLADIFVAEGNKIYDKKIAIYKEWLEKLEKNRFVGDRERIFALEKLLILANNFVVFYPANLPRQPIQFNNNLDTIILLFLTGIMLSLFAVSFQEFWEKNTKKDG